MSTTTARLPLAEAARRCLVCGTALRHLTPSKLADGRGKICSSRCRVVFTAKRNTLTRDVRIPAFWARVDTSGGPDACWPWLGPCDPHGYGPTIFDGRRTHAHRVAWELANGPIPPGQMIRHVVCDNPPCCNPAHLAPGGQSANMADMRGHGRGWWQGSRRAEVIAGRARASHTKLTPESVREIRALAATGVYQRVIAARFGVSERAVWFVIHRVTWRHVEDAALGLAFINNGGAVKRFCNVTCRDENDRVRRLGRKKGQITRDTTISDRRTYLGAINQAQGNVRQLSTDLRAARLAVEAMCRACESTGSCATPGCPLRTVSPFALRQAHHEAERRPRTNREIRVGAWTPERRATWTDGLHERWTPEAKEAARTDPKILANLAEARKTSVAAVRRRSKASFSAASKLAWANRRAKAAEEATA